MKSVIFSFYIHSQSLRGFFLARKFNKFPLVLRGMASYFPRFSSSSRQIVPVYLRDYLLKGDTPAKRQG